MIYSFDNGGIVCKINSNPTSFTRVSASLHHVPVSSPFPLFLLNDKLIKVQLSDLIDFVVSLLSLYYIPQMKEIILYLHCSMITSPT